MDASGAAVALANEINFFADDNVTGQNEAFPGSVDCIRVFDAAVVPIPAALPLLASALVLTGLGLRSVRRPVRRRATRW